MQSPVAFCEAQRSNTMIQVFGKSTLTIGYFDKLIQTQHLFGTSNAVLVRALRYPISPLQALSRCNIYMRSKHIHIGILSLRRKKNVNGWRNTPSLNITNCFFLFPPHSAIQKAHSHASFPTHCQSQTSDTHKKKRHASGRSVRLHHIAYYAQSK
jgi:hypothetical protein